MPRMRGIMSGAGIDKLHLTSGHFSAVMGDSMPRRPEPRIQNRLVDLNFAGWRSNTYELQQNGWQISVQEMHDTFQMRIAIKHPATGLYGITQSVNHGRMHDLEEMRRHSGVELFVIAMGTDIRVMPYHVVECGSMENFNPVDARPTVTLEPAKHLDDFNIFRPLAKTEQIIIPDESVTDLLDRIHKMQDPKQLEIREKRRKDIRRQMRDCNEQVNNYDLGVNIVAQVATLT